MKKDYSTLIWVLGLLSGLMPFATDLYLPAFGRISEDLGINHGQVALTLSSYFVGSCLGHLIAGPVLDKYGRRKPILWGLIIFMLSSVACVFTAGLMSLVVFRFVQAIGTSLCSVGGRTVVRDVFPPEKIAYVFSTLALIMGVAPVIAPSVGSLILEFSHWHGVFWFLGILAFVIWLVVYFLLPESLERDKDYSLHPKAMLTNYKTVLLTPSFFTYALITSLASGSLFAWISSSSFVFMETFGLSSRQFGWVFASTASFLIMSNQLNRFLLKKFKTTKISFWAAVIQIGISVLLIGVVEWAYTIPLMLGALYLFMLSIHLIRPNALALALIPFTKNVGMANALLGTITMMVNAAVIALLSLFFDGTSGPMVYMMLSIAVVSVVLQFLGMKRLGIQ
ncbi:multidrug effflux MFS transporter [Jiulongibacter sp. NS-SX5]|uniref:multidrug effflux MFS transporter n=1 Tax=Jiulongibacter sp. NS-SX5 TaxID=3463854 RepID=UPI0040591D36